MSCIEILWSLSFAKECYELDTPNIKQSIWF